MTPNPTKLLFVCSRNKIRSLTAEKLFAGLPGYEVRSAGTQPAARCVVNEGHIGWADFIFCMEKSHVQKIRERFPEKSEGKRLIALHIPDEFEFMEEALIDELKGKVAEYLTLPETAV